MPDTEFRKTQLTRSEEGANNCVSDFRKKETPGVTEKWANREEDVVWGRIL